MVMNVQPIPTMSERINEIRNLTAAIVNKEILPNEQMLWASRNSRRSYQLHCRTGTPTAGKIYALIPAV